MSDERGNLGDSERCHRCGGANVVWAAQSPLWNLVMRGNDINGEPLHHDLVCMPCFVVLAEEAGVKGQWHLTVDPEPEGLIKVTPSGRIWDPTRWLWVDPKPDWCTCEYGRGRPHPVGSRGCLFNADEDHPTPTWQATP